MFADLLIFIVYKKLRQFQGLQVQQQQQPLPQQNQDQQEPQIAIQFLRRSNRQTRQPQRYTP